MQNGFKDVRALKGGFNTWVDDGLPLELKETPSEGEQPWVEGP